MYMPNNLGKLYIVGTPIGNLEDITFRAISTLQSVDLILCEDTRTTGKLLNHYSIKTPTMSYHSHSKLSKVGKIQELIEDGKNLALVCDAGTPAISDPGVMLIAHLKQALGSDFIVSPIPGPSAIISALSASGIPAHEYTWLGFVPHKKGRETFFKRITEIGHTVVFYESVHRINKTLESLRNYIPSRTVTIGRELTKMFEEIVTGTPDELIHYYSIHKEKVRGEFVLIVGPEK
jgi:16S rRNA (cytidine1402-2'-O)-methyltransferase